MRIIKECGYGGREQEREQDVRFPRRERDPECTESLVLLFGGGSNNRDDDEAEN